MRHTGSTAAVATGNTPPPPVRLRAVPPTRPSPHVSSVLIELTAVTKVYDARSRSTVTALADIDLQIPERAATLITGPSGSGKSTLLGIIGCMMRPTSGRVTVFGHDVTRFDEDMLAERRRHHFGFVFQNRYLIRRATALENVMVPALPCRHSVRDLRGRARTLLANLGLASKANQRVEHLSGGEQQRVALARALINDPDVILADEPTAHLDAGSSHTFFDLLGALITEGKSAIVASHDPALCNLGTFRERVELCEGHLA